MSTHRDHFQEAVDPVVRAMRENLAAGLTLTDMADIACLSPFHFHRVFHQTAGIPPGQFLTALRMDAAKRLLLTTTETIVDVCFAVGYSSPGTFTTGFTRLVGETPSAFRALPRIFAETGLWEAGLAMSPAAPQNSLSPTGRIIGPADFRGIIFIGAFPKRVPQSLPLAGVLREQPGAYLLPPLSDGTYHIMVAAVPADDPQSLFLPGDGLLVGIGERPLTVAHGVGRTPVDVVLRRPLDTDPPIVVALPTLLRRQPPAPVST